MEVDYDDILKRPADARGRVTLGSEYADCEVEIAILGVDDDG